MNRLVCFKFKKARPLVVKVPVSIGWPNKRFKRDSQRAAFLLCVGFCDYGVMRKVSSSVVCPLSGR